jgi:dUTP pyrophosphatase|tara:strand:- start:162 stop:722 length:561 start_codon:yes stop_codon:yes gene_type:complete
MASQAIQSFFELKLWVSDDVEGLREKYTAAAMKHNAVSVPCIYESHLGEFDAGFDLFCPDMVVVAGDTVKINHQIKSAMDKYTPNGWSGGKPVGYYLYPRSSTGTKTPLRLANSVGIIDSGYRGNIIAAFDNLRSDGSGYVVGAFNRVVQICPPDISYPMVVTMVNRVEELGETKRDAGGFGSTGV